MERVRLFGIDIDPLTMKETVNLIDQRIQQHQVTHLLGVNADKINSLKKSKKYARIVKEAQVINADGASLVIASKLLKQPLPERVAGIDLMQELLDLAEDKNYSVYFIGAKPEVVSRMVVNLRKQHPSLNIAGYQHGYFRKDDWQQISAEIKYCQPQIIFFGITSPTKEYVIDYLMQDGVNSILMGVGGSFDVLAGKIKRAPRWAQKSNMEWAYRVLQEPKRLFKRYLFGNTSFILKVVKAKLSMR